MARRSPGLETFEARFATFAHWPENGVPHPHRMAQAGFFYHGYVDQVSCFHCGVDLNGWKLHDDPWTEHAAHAGECPFLNEMKTREFIETAIMRRDFSMQSRTENYVANALHKFEQDVV
jgi:baculoviral IAP repeat-containing protein 7/8